MARPRGDIAPRLLHAARRRFLTEGVDGASLRAIAADAGTNIGMIYYYYPTKDELFLAVVEEVYTGVLAGITAALDPQQPVIERIRQLFARMGALSVDEGEVLRLIVREALASPLRLQSLIGRFRRGHVPMMIDLIREGVRDGHLRADVSPAALLVAMVALAGPAQFLLGMVRANLGLPESFDAIPPAPDRPAGREAPSPARNPALLEVLLQGIAADRTPPDRSAPSTQRPTPPKRRAQR